MKSVRLAGVVFVWLGIVLMLNSFIGITGLAIVEGNFLSVVELFEPVLLVGVFFLVVGFLMMSRKGKDSPLESDAHIHIEYTRTFEKAIKKHDPNKIYNAIRRIGTGLGKEEELTGEGKGYKSIRAGHGERIIFHMEDDEHAVVDAYTSDHDYKGVLRSLPRRDKKDRAA